MARLPCCLSMGPMKQDFLHIYLITFPESKVWEIQNVRGSSFCLKCSRFNADLKNAEKNSEKIFVKNCILIAIVNFSRLRTGYLSSPANMVGNSPKSWHITNRDFSELNCLRSD